MGKVKGLNTDNESKPITDGNYKLANNITFTTDMDKVLSKEEIQEARFGNYAKQFGGSVTVDIFCSMDEYAKQLAIGFAEWMQYDYGWGNLAGKYYSYADTDVEYDAEELYEMYLQSLNK